MHGKGKAASRVGSRDVDAGEKGRGWLAVREEGKEGREERGREGRVGDLRRGG